MILRNLDAPSRDPAGFLLFLLLTIIALVIGITVHEFSHAMVATGLGDPTAKRLGRVSLDPRAHLDPAGSLMLLLAGFGWGKPVPVNALAFRNSFQGMAMVALAGPASNIIAASLLAVPLKLRVLEWVSPFRNLAFVSGPGEFISQFIAITIYFNLILAVFNLIPLAPLDGSKIVLGLLPRNLAADFHRLEPWGPGILLSVILIDILTGARILARTIGPAVNVLSAAIAGHSLF